MNSDLFFRVCHMYWSAELRIKRLAVISVFNSRLTHSGCTHIIDRLVEKKPKLDSFTFYWPGMCVHMNMGSFCCVLVLFSWLIIILTNIIWTKSWWRSMRNLCVCFLCVVMYLRRPTSHNPHIMTSPQTLIPHFQGEESSAKSDGLSCQDWPVKGTQTAEKCNNGKVIGS